MSVAFTSDIESERMNKKKSTWDLYSGESIVQAVRLARDLGWKDKKVQVRHETLEDGTDMYYVEPYEKGCGCKGMLKYRDYFN